MCLSYLSVSKHSDVCELQGILLSDDTTDSDTDSDDSDFTMTREELQDMLRLHKFTKLHQSKFHSDREVRHACWVWDSCPRINSFMETVGNVCLCSQLQHYQHYSTGLLSTHDPFYEQQRHLLGLKKKKIKEEKKCKSKPTEQKRMKVAVFWSFEYSSFFCFHSQVKKDEKEEETRRGVLHGGTAARYKNVCQVFSWCTSSHDQKEALNHRAAQCS